MSYSIQELGQKGATKTPAAIWPFRPKKSFRIVTNWSHQGNLITLTEVIGRILNVHKSARADRGAL